MSVSEHDLETVEGWLDGELSEEQTSELRNRLSAEPQLAEAVARLRGDREMRVRMWQAMEPSAGEIESLVARVRSNVRKEDLWSIRARTLSRISAIAASVAVVFMAGWMSRSRLQTGMPVQPTVAVVQPRTVSPDQLQPVPPGSNATLVSAPRGNNPIVNYPLNPNLSMVSLPAPQTIPLDGISRVAPNYRVQILDPISRDVIYSRQIERLDDARQLADYIAKFPAVPDPTRLLDPSKSLNYVSEQR